MQGGGESRGAQGRHKARIPGDQVVQVGGAGRGGARRGGGDSGLGLAIRAGRGRGVPNLGETAGPRYSAVQYTVSLGARSGGMEPGAAAAAAAAAAESRGCEVCARPAGGGGATET